MLKELTRLLVVVLDVFLEGGAKVLDVFREGVAQVFDDFLEAAEGGRAEEIRDVTLRVECGRSRMEGAGARGLSSTGCSTGSSCLGGAMFIWLIRMPSCSPNW